MTSPTHMHTTHHHDHHHGHGGKHHHGLTHNHAAEARSLAANPANRRALALALGIAVTVMTFEFVGGLITNSVALLGDAVHMAADSSAYLIALIAARVARRPITARRTYGWARGEILAAFVNSALLVALSIGLVVEASRRLGNPEPVDGSGVAVIATIGLVANIAVVLVLFRADRHNLNIRGALLHGITDTLSSAWVVAAGLLVSLTGMPRIDSVATYIIAALTLWGAWSLMRDSVDVLLDAAPRNIDTSQVAQAMLNVAGIVDVHDLHLWQITPEQPALSVHVRIAEGIAHDHALAQLERVLREQFSIHHTTIQITAGQPSSSLHAVASMPADHAVDWVVEHLSRIFPHVHPEHITQATRQALAGHEDGEAVSPVALSARTRQHLQRAREDASDA